MRASEFLSRHLEFQEGETFILYDLGLSNGIKISHFYIPEEYIFSNVEGYSLIFHKKNKNGTRGAKRSIFNTTKIFHTIEEATVEFKKDLEEIKDKIERKYQREITSKIDKGISFLIKQQIDL